MAKRSTAAVNDAQLGAMSVDSATREQRHDPPFHGADDASRHADVTTTSPPVMEDEARRDTSARAHRTIARGDDEAVAERDRDRRRGAGRT
jgi:hypothetical protein